jgi:ribonuclease P protein component
MNRKYSLRSNRDIEKLVHHKKSVGNKYYAIYYKKTVNEMPQIAFSISKKCGNAVIRNHEKRITKEIVRQYLELMNYMQLLIVIKKQSLDIPFALKKTNLEYLLKKITKEIINE